MLVGVDPDHPEPETNKGDRMPTAEYNTAFAAQLGDTRRDLAIMGCAVEEQRFQIIRDGAFLTMTELEYVDADGMTTQLLFAGTGERAPLDAVKRF
jgi:hypothetical protein